MNAVRAEWIKLTSTRAPIWGVIVVAVLGLGTAVLLGQAEYGVLPMPPEKAATGVVAFGVPVLMVLAAMTVTAEYRSGMIRTTFLTTPNRTRVLCAKAAVGAVAAGLCAGAATVAAVLTAQLVAPAGAAAGLSLTAPDTWREVAAVGLYAAVAAVLAIGVAALVRASAVTVAVLLLWPLVVEVLLGILPGTGARIGPYLPFANAAAFTGVQMIYPGYDMHWGPVGGFVYFTAVVAVVFGVALAMLNRRDA